MSALSTLPVGHWLNRVNALLDRIPAPAPTTLETELEAAALATTVTHFKALERLGVDRGTLCDLWRHDYGFGVTLATAGEDGLYYPGEGEPHLVLPVYEDGEVIDLCAFRSADPNGWLLRTGLGWTLGVESGLERHTWEPAFLAVSPLEWLQRGATGLCVVDWTAPEVAYLRDIPRLHCSTPFLANRLRAALSVPVRLPEISVGEMPLAA